MDLKEAKISDGEGVGRHPWEEAKKEVVASLINRFLPTLGKQNDTILDIGCGDTWLIQQLSEVFPKAKFIGVDNAFDADLLLKYTTTLQGKPIQLYENLEIALKDTGENINLVLLLDVLEHIENDVNFLKWVLTFDKQIDQNTIFLITVPAFQHLYYSLDEFLGHYRRYTNSQIISTVNQAGLEVLQEGYFFSTLLPVRFVEVILEKLFNFKKQTKGIGGWKKSELDPYLKNCLIVDYKITSFLRSLGIKLPGLSNYILCKKRV